MSVGPDASNPLAGACRGGARPAHDRRNGGSPPTRCCSGGRAGPEPPPTFAACPLPPAHRSFLEIMKQFKAQT